MAASLTRVLMTAAVAACSACPSSPGTTGDADAGEAEGTQTRFEVPALTVVIAHDRSDLVLETLTVAFYCLPRVGGQGGAAFATCGELLIDGRPGGENVDFAATGRDRAATKPITIRFSTRAENVMCIGMKVFFQGIPNQTDSAIYADLEDRYSILSYCTDGTLPAQHAEQPRWSHRRAATFQDFVTRLGQPIAIALKPKA